MKYRNFDAGKQKCRDYFREQRAKQNHTRSQPRQQPRSRPRNNSIYRPLHNPSPPRANPNFYNPQPKPLKYTRPLVPIREQEQPRQPRQQSQAQQPIIIQQPAPQQQPIYVQQPPMQGYYPSPPRTAKFTFLNVTGMLVICAIAFSVFMAISTRDPAGVIDMWKSAFEFVVTGIQDILAGF